MCKGKRRKKKAGKYVFVSEDVKYSGEEAIDEWQGRIRGIKMEIQRNSKKQEEELKKVGRKLDEEQRKKEEWRKKQEEAEKGERVKSEEKWAKTEEQLSKNQELLCKILKRIEEVSESMSKEKTQGWMRVSEAD